MASGVIDMQHSVHMNIIVVKTLIELFSVMMTIRMCGPDYPESRSDRYARPCRGHRLDGTGPNMAKAGSPSGVRMDLADAPLFEAHFRTF